MTHKLKLLLFWLLVLLSVSISDTYAITFVGSSNDISALSTYEWKTLVDGGYGYLSCIDGMNPTASNLTIDMRCSEDMYKRFAGAYYWPWLSLNGFTVLSNGDYHFYVESWSNHIFTMMKLDYEDKPKYVKVTMRNLMSKMLSVQSQRGENIYDFAVVDGLGFSLRVKDEDQVRAAQVIANSYILDGYILVASSSNSYLLDTYTNKLYWYNSQFYIDSMQKMGATGIFPKLRNVVPDSIRDIEWNVGSSSLNYSVTDVKYFDFINQREGKKADLAELRENLRKSIVILNEEHAEYFLWQAPEELGIGAWSPNTDNQLNTSGSNTSHQVQNSGAEEKKACVDYYTKMKMFTSISASCRWESKEWQEKYEYWENILFGMYDQYTTRDKVRYWNCYNFWIIKEKWIKSFGKERFDSFQKDRETKYLYSQPNDVDINAMCSHIQLTSSEKLQEVKDNQPWYDKLFRSLWFLWAWSWTPLAVDWSWNALYQWDFQEELKSLQPYYWQCQGYDKYWLTKITQTEDQKTKACNLYNKYKTQLLDKWKGVELEYTNDSTAEWQITMQEQRLGKWNWMLESVSSWVSNTLSEWWEVLLKVVKDPFNSWYNSILPLQCWNKQNFPIMNYVLLWVFSFLIFIFLKAM